MSDNKKPDKKKEKRTAIKAGLDTDKLDFRVGYKVDTHINNTQLSDEKEKEFKKWADERSKKLNRNVMNDQGDYDLRADFVSGGKLAENNHGSDIGKKPNHPTFSEGSKYSRAGQRGGRWTDDHFIPSEDMMKNKEKMNELVKYMKREEKDKKFLSPYIAKQAGKIAQEKAKNKAR